MLAQLRETWDSECTTFEVTDDPDPYRSERIETVPAPDGVDPDHWAADCAELTLLEEDLRGIVNCSALVAVGEHVIVAIELQGLVDERDSHVDLLGAIASEVIEAQE